MKVTPKTEDQIAKERLMPKGTYAFEVAEATDETSKAGNEMIHLQVRVFCGDTVRRLDDYLLDSMAFKIRHFAEHTGLIDRYNAGELRAADCDSKSGWAKIGVQEGKDGFGPKNVIADYVAMPGHQALAPAAKSQPTDAQLANQEPHGSDVKVDDVPF